MSANADAIGMPVEELETPALCLDLEAYRRNLRRMADYIIGTHGLAWRPHMKGQKAPELAHEAVAAGAAGVTCATLYEAEAMVDSGVENILLANQVAGARKLARLARLARRGRVIAATDSQEHAAQLNTAALAERAIVPVLVEVDVGMKRCGVAAGAPAAQLASCIHQMPGLRFLGVMGWEGHAVPLQGEQKQSAIAASIERLADSAEACRAAGLILAAICRFILPAERTEPLVKDRAAPLSFPAAASALLRIPSFLVLAGAGVLTAIGTWIFINWLPLYFRENMGMTLASAGFFGSSLVSLSGAAGQVVGGVASDRFARGGAHRRMLLHAMLILCAAPMLLVFVLTHSLTLIMTALVVYSLLRTSADLNMLPLICDLAGVDKRSTAFGITNMVNTLAGGLGVFVAGYLKSGFGLDGVFAGVAGILTLDAVLLFTGYFFLLRKDLRASGVK